MPINSQAKGKRAERDLANWWKNHGFPNAERAVKTGTSQTHDAGDLILECEDFRMCVEVKHHAGGLSDLQVHSFGVKLSQQCLQSKSNLGVLVERRDRVSDPGRWWVHIHASDFAQLELGYPDWNLHPHASWDPVRVSVEKLAALLSQARLALPWPAVATCPCQAHRTGADAMAERPQAVGGT